MPRRPRPVVFLGAGGIVRAAHGPAYRAAGIPMLGCFDVVRATAERTARELGIASVFRTLDEASAQPDVVFDVAVPAEAILPVLRALPDRAVVLIQKPMGRTLGEARSILALCSQKRLVAAVNFQLRFSPNVLALRELLAAGRIGTVSEVEIRTLTHTPWDQWKFLAGIPRMEILYHSIHYLDLVRALFGEPEGVQCSAASDPNFRGYADTRSTTILRYAHGPRVVVTTQHSHDFGREHAASAVRLEGASGAALATLGVNLDYPRGEPDRLLFAARGRSWKSIPLVGSWFPDAFRGTMQNLQRFAAGEDEVLHTCVHDAARTMALVEACYRSASRPATSIPAVRAPHA